MAVVAVVGVLLWAGLYRFRYGDIDRLLVNTQLREMARGDAQHRRMAVENLATTGPDELSLILPALSDVARDSDVLVRMSAVRTTGLTARRWQFLRRQLAGEEIARAKRILIGAVDDPSDGVRLEAIRRFEELGTPLWGPPPPSATPSARSHILIQEDMNAADALLRRIDDRNAEIRVAALLALARVPVASEGAFDRVVKALIDDADESVRGTAALALARGWPGRDVASLLLDRLAEVKTNGEKVPIVRAIHELGRPPVESIPPLIDALALDDWSLNQMIPDILEKLGPSARPALPALGKLATREFTDPLGAALRAGHAVAAIDPDSPEAQRLLAPLADGLRDASDNTRRQQAAWVLTQYGASAAPIVPALREALRSDVADVRDRAAWVLGRIGPAALPAVADLSELAHREPGDYKQAAAAIRQITGE